MTNPPVTPNLPHPLDGHPVEPFLSTEVATRSNQRSVSGDYTLLQEGSRLSMAMVNEDEGEK